VSVPLAQLVSRARTHANMQVGGPWDAGEWDAAINDAVRAFYLDCNEKNPTWKITVATLTIASTATPHTTLPADFMNMYRVTAQAGSSEREPIYYSGDERAEEWMRTYRIEGTEFYIDPLERAADDYEIRYNPLPVAITAANPLAGELEQFREYFELYAAMQALADEESSTADLEKKFKPWAIRAQSWALRRRSSDPMRPRDVRPRGFLRRRF